MPTLGRRQASDLRAFGARDAHSSLPDQPGRLNLELQAMNVLLRSGLIGFPHLVDWKVPDLLWQHLVICSGSKCDTFFFPFIWMRLLSCGFCAGVL
ncbi:hypothetical protein AFLA_005667 [Aspergillus flavus NRRL3357]|nr:hypothetical protein AFLA_005667 [Aspergillus flavus NRRL3357]